jgi:sec-independent protein translocase protein TatA
VRDRRLRRGAQYALGMAGLGAPELIIILIVILVLFGGAKLPKLARSLGQAQKEFKDGLADGSKGEETQAPPPQAQPAPPPQAQPAPPPQGPISS